MSTSRPPQRRRRKKPSSGIDRAISQLPVPPHRRLPKYKRAQESYSWDAWAPREKWEKAEGRWAQHGIQPSAIYRILREAATARMDFEDDLINDLELAKDEIVYRAFIRGFNQRLRSVFVWLQQYRWMPEAQVTGDHLQRAVSELADRLAPLQPRAHRTFRFKGRPGEWWLPSIVRQLFKIFRNHSMRANVTTRSLVEALTLAGHGDVVNLPLIKRLTRKR
jgi:hypothetical protein